MPMYDPAHPGEILGEDILEGVKFTLTGGR